MSTPKPDETKPDPTKPDQPQQQQPQRNGERNTETQRKARRRAHVGASVLYISSNGGELVENAATITKLHEGGAADLHVLYADGEPAREKRVLESEGSELGRWRWSRE